jgi:23S rRNA G2445 N2-methylase RlmL
MREFLATTIPGTEEALCEELRELKLPGVRLNRGGIPFRGEWVDGWRACLCSRIAQRIQVLLGRFPAPDADALYAGARAIDWREFLTPRHTLAVHAVSRDAGLHHSGFVALKTKDAIVDALRDTAGGRPSIAREDPDVRVFTHVAGGKAAVYVDLAGEPLHKRGYRLAAHEAPLQENLAAALLRMSGWDRSTPLTDPLCGAGTIAIEAALWAGNIAPGLRRPRFGFERWAMFGETEAVALRELKGRLRAEANGRAVRVTAGDADPRALDAARANARAAGVRPAFRERSALALQRGDGVGIAVTNPPYGVRLDVEPDFPRALMATFSRLHGWRVCLLAGTPLYERDMAVPPTRKLPLTNGDLPCDVLIYDVP